MRIFLCILSFFIANTLLAASDSIQNVAAQGKPLFLFFYREQNEKTQRLERVFDQTMQKMGHEVVYTKINIKDPAQQPLVDKYSLKRTPMPFLLAVAPNGAITGGFPSFSEEQLRSALVSQGTARLLKGLQDRKLVVLALQNNATQHNAAAMQGVNEFKADPRFGSAVEVVLLDPADSSENDLFKMLALNTNINQAQTVLIAPPAEILAQYQGPTTKGQFVDCVCSAASGCCAGGCCAGGCCPGGKCGK